MGWVDLEAPHPPSYAPKKWGVTIRALAQKGRRGARITIAFRTAQMPEITWLRPGATCSIALGTDENAGRIRITPGGDFTLACTSWRQKFDTVFVRMMPLAATTLVSRSPEQATFDYDKDWIQVDLPLWALPPAQGTAPVSGAGARPTKAPYRGILAQTPMPHAGRS